MQILKAHPDFVNQSTGGEGSISLCFNKLPRNVQYSEPLLSFHELSFKFLFLMAANKLFLPNFPFVVSGEASESS